MFMKPMPYDRSSGTLDTYCRYAHIEDRNFVRCMHPTRNKTWKVTCGGSDLARSICKRCMYNCTLNSFDGELCAGRESPRTEVKNRFSTDKEAPT